MNNEIESYQCIMIGNYVNGSIKWTWCSFKLHTKKQIKCFLLNLILIHDTFYPIIFHIKFLIKIMKVINISTSKAFCRDQREANNLLRFHETTMF